MLVVHGIARWIFKSTHTCQQLLFEMQVRTPVVGMSCYSCRRFFRAPRGPLSRLVVMARHSSALLKAAVVACALLALNQLAFVAPGSSPKLRGQEAAVAGAVLAGLPAAPALATDQASDAISQQDWIIILLPIAFVWVLFLDWEGKQPSADDVTGYGALGPTIDGPTPDQPKYFRRSPENG